jgi:hypothetical protein
MDMPLLGIQLLRDYVESVYGEIPPDYQ